MGRFLGLVEEVDLVVVLVAGMVFPLPCRLQHTHSPSPFPLQQYQPMP